MLFLDGQGAACDVTLTALGRDEVRGQVPSLEHRRPDIYDR